MKRKIGLTRLKCTTYFHKKTVELTICMQQAKISAKQKFLLYAAGPDMGQSTSHISLPSVDRLDGKQAEKLCSMLLIGNLVLSMTKI